MSYQAMYIGWRPGHINELRGNLTRNRGPVSASPSVDGAVPPQGCATGLEFEITGGCGAPRMRTTWEEIGCIGPRPKMLASPMPLFIGWLEPPRPRARAYERKAGP